MAAMAEPMQDPLVPAADRAAGYVAAAVAEPPLVAGAEQLALPDAAHWLRALKDILRSEDLAAVTIRWARRRLAVHLNMGEHGLETRKEEVAQVIQQAVAELTAERDATLSWLTAEDQEARQQIFLVTFAALLHSSDSPLEGAQPLVDPSSISKETIRDALLDSISKPCETPAAGGGRPRKQGLVQARVLVVAKERHESRPDFNHFHAVVKVVPLTRFLPAKLALRARHGLASHWSTSHSQLWSALRYITMATERKQHVDAEPLVWTADGRPLNLFEASQAPWNAATLKKRREARALAPPEEPACKKGKNSGTRERFGKMDLVSLILAESLTSPAQIMAYVQTKGSLVMQDFVSRQQRHLKEILAEAHDWAGAESTAAGEVETDWSIVQRLARQDCACGADGCSWWAAAEAFFAANAPGAGRAGVDRQLLAATLRAVIETGPSKINRVPCLLGPTNSEKHSVRPSS